MGAGKNTLDNERDPGKFPATYSRMLSHYTKALILTRHPAIILWHLGKLKSSRLKRPAGYPIFTADGKPLNRCFGA
jgi:hypothetical protein